MRAKLLVPLAVFAVLCAFLLVGLWRDPREVPSPLVGKPAPAFTLAQLHEPAKTLAPAACAAAMSCTILFTKSPITNGSGFIVASLKMTN